MRLTQFSDQARHHFTKLLHALQKTREVLLDFEGELLSHVPRQTQLLGQLLERGNYLMADDDAHQLLGVVLDRINVDERGIESKDAKAVSDESCFATSIGPKQ